jgi:hypothetical protein
MSELIEAPIDNWLAAYDGRVLETRRIKKVRCGITPL